MIDGFTFDRVIRISRLRNSNGAIRYRSLLGGQAGRGRPVFQHPHTHALQDQPLTPFRRHNHFATMEARDSGRPYCDDCFATCEWHEEQESRTCQHEDTSPMDRL